MDGTTLSEHVSPVSTLRKDENVVRKRMAEVFSSPVQRLLMVAVPEIDRTLFSLDVAIQKRYPCFPPYGPTILVRCAEAAGYPADIIDLQFEVLRKAVKTEGRAFDFSVWEELLEAKIEAFKPDVIALSGMFKNCAAEYAAIVRHLKSNYPKFPIKFALCRWWDRFIDIVQ